jgi:hypothetical protein
MSNSEKYPKAWSFFEENARNIVNEETINSLGNYRIPEPNKSGNFIYANSPEKLWLKFIRKWFHEDLNSESLYGKIQYIVNNLNH